MAPRGSSSSGQVWGRVGMPEYSASREHFLEEAWLSADEGWRVLAQPGRVGRAYRSRVPDLGPGDWRPGIPLSLSPPAWVLQIPASFFPEVSGAFGRPSPVGKIKSPVRPKETLGQKAVGGATGRPQGQHPGQQESPNPICLLEFSVWNAQPEFWVHVKPMVQRPP